MTVFYCRNAVFPFFRPHFRRSPSGLPPVRAVLCLAAAMAAQACPAGAAAQGVSARTPDRPGISVLSPVQVFPVEAPRPVTEIEVEDDAPGLWPDEDDPAAWNYAPQWGKGRVGEVRVAQGLGGSGYAQPGGIWSQVHLGARNWSYRNGSHGLAVGGVTAAAPAWAGTSRLGGVQFGRSAGPGLLAPGEVGYSSSLGMLDYSSAPDQPGGLTYGPSAGAGAMRMGVSEALTMESLVQAAPGMRSMGVGGLYAAGGLGSVQAAAVQSRYLGHEDWRYAVAYQAELQGVRLGLRHEQSGPGYVDLSSYQSGPSGDTRWRNALTAGMAFGSAGVLEGSYAAMGSGPRQEQQLGLEHSLPFGSGGARLALGASRNLTLGEYGMSLRLSLPVDMLTGLGRR